MSITDLIDRRITKLKDDLSRKRIEIGDLDAKRQQLDDDCRAIEIAIKELNAVKDEADGETPVAQEKVSNGESSNGKFRPSVFILHAIRESDDGLTSGDVWEMVKDKITSNAANPRNLVGTTLYNLKKRGEGGAQRRDWPVHSDSRMTNGLTENARGIAYESKQP